MNIYFSYLRDQFCGPANHSAPQISATISGLSTLLGQTSELPAVEIRQNSPITSITDLSKPTDNVAIMAENNLFGQLVANGMWYTVSDAAEHEMNQFFVFQENHW